MASEANLIEVSPRAKRLAGISAGLLPLIFFSFGHFCVDVYSSALGILQPLLLDRFHLSLTQAGILGGTLVFSSSAALAVVHDTRTRRGRGFHLFARLGG